VARVVQQGNYTFLKSDLAARDPGLVVLTGPQTQVIDQGPAVLYHIP